MKPSYHRPLSKHHACPEDALFATWLLPGLLATAASPPPSADTRPVHCDDCAQWNQPQPPFRISGNTWYVGTRGLSALLVDTGHGLVLLDGGLPQSAQRIADSVRALGFDIGDVKWILNSHAHFDHAGGIASLQRLSGAQVAASARGRDALRLGGVAVPDDPQAGFGEAFRFPGLPDVQTIADGGTIELGDVTLVARYTPGHTPGATTWTWRSCEGARCVDMVYADSLSAVPGPGFRFSEDPALVRRLRASIAVVRALPCDVMVSTHPDASQVFRQLAASKQAGRQAFVDSGACHAYADNALQKLDARLRAEASAKVQAPPAR
jgi:metallo-beta-lactamase class B